MPYECIVSDAMRNGKAVVRLHNNVTVGGKQVQINAATRMAAALEIQRLGYWCCFQPDGNLLVVKKPDVTQLNHKKSDKKSDGGGGGAGGGAGAGSAPRSNKYGLTQSDVDRLAGSLSATVEGARVNLVMKVYTEAIIWSPERAEKLKAKRDAATAAADQAAATENNNKTVDLHCAVVDKNGAPFVCAALDNIVIAALTREAAAPPAPAASAAATTDEKKNEKSPAPPTAAAATDAAGAGDAAATGASGSGAEKKADAVATAAPSGGVAADAAAATKPTVALKHWAHNIVVVVVDTITAEKLRSGRRSGTRFDIDVARSSERVMSL
jgi:hypothetical protein